MKHRYGAFVLSVLSLGMVSFARAQTTIDVPITSMLGNTGTRGAGQGGNVPTISGIDANDPPPLNRHIQGFQPGSYAEFPVTTTTPGMYSVTLGLRQPGDDHTVFALESRPSPDSLYTTRYATVDTKDYGRISDTAYPATLLVDAANQTLTIPLAAGDNILRIFDTTGRHNPVTTGYPTDLSNPTNRAPGWPWSDVRISSITLNRVGDLPTLGTINGTITADQPAGLPVRDALVTANPAGQSPAEPSWFWMNGWYTTTRPDGTYTLKAPLGQQEVKAGRPDSYQLQGATTSVTVGAAPVTANITLPSIFFKNAANEWTAFPQAEYFTSKNGSLALVPLDGPPENGYKIGWTDGGEWYGLRIDVPESGNYEVTSAYTNGGGEGTFRVYTELGPSSTDTQPNSGGWGTLAHKIYANPIYLVQGTQIIYQRNDGGNSDFDAIHLRRLNTPATVGLVQGKVTNAINGTPVPNATVAIGASTSVQTDAEGNYRAIVPVGVGTSITVTHVNMDSAVTGSVDVTAGGAEVRNFTISLRPSVELTTANGYAWKYTANTGGTADYSAVAASETGFTEIAVPSNVADVVPTNDIYIWYRLHFTVPEGFLTAFPGRLVRLRIPGVDDLDATWLNGTLIGQTGGFPTTPLDAKPADYRNPAAGADLLSYPGLDLAYNNERNYYFPASLLKTGDNVLAMKVFQLSGGAGITTTPYLEIAPATGTVSGKVLVGGTGQAGVRVAAMSPAGLSSDWALTSADGSFTLDNVFPGALVVGAAKPGVKPVSVTTSVAANGTVSNLTLNTAVEPAGVAPLYDDFIATSSADATWWTNLWDAISIEPSNPRVPADEPTIYEPGYKAISHPVQTASDPQMPGTITIQSGTGHRGGLLSKTRFSKYASVSAGRLVSALPAAPVGTSTSANVIFRLVGNAAADVPSQINSANYVELDLEGYNGLEGEFGFPEQRVRYRLFTSHGGEVSQGAVNSDITNLGDLSMDKGLEVMITRVGSFYDFYVNGTRVHSQNLPNALPENHKVFLYAWDINQVHTWDWVKAGPAAYSVITPGDITGEGTINAADVAKALRIWGGLDAATPAEVQSGNVNPDAGITILDALRISKAVNGLPL